LLQKLRSFGQGSIGVGLTEQITQHRIDDTKRSEM
jgi:hypothetical protein